MVIAAAKPSDVSRIMQLIDEAKEFLKKSGVDQWQDGYPSLAIITQDIAAGSGYVIWDQETIIGYACISFDGEAAYDTIDGAWLSIQPYAVVHRLAVDSSRKGQGLASRLLQYAEELCAQRGIHSIKIDTDQRNEVMKHLLPKNGYTFCGDVTFEGSPKIAYEKLL